MDFGGLKDLKTLLEQTFDHTLVVDKNDPQLGLFRQLASVDAAKIVIMENGVGIEKFSEYVFKVADKFVSNVTNKRVWVTKVEVWEHEKNSAIYSEEVPFMSTNLVESNTTLEVPLQAEEIKLEVPPAPAPAPAQHNPHAARVGNVRSSGWSNPFAGTSWGM
jgi:6-pyruvoyl-tetrahydropterin synthase